MVQLSHPYMTYWENNRFDYTDLFGEVMSLLFNMLSRFAIAFLPRRKCLNFVVAVTIRSNFGAQENKICHCFHCFPIFLSSGDGTRCHNLSFLNVEFLSQIFHSPLSPSSRCSLVPLHFLPLEWYHLCI